ncbi:hypothetical protein FBR03_03425 [Betaproteobacteria bacterium PRO1]|nr:hypothetical protein [Burkholderiaceae bacterium]MDL1906508.1 hypothetical protein [Betaproteobacteria bacterium PRO1]
MSRPFSWGSALFAAAIASSAFGGEAPTPAGATAAAAKAQARMALVAIAAPGARQFALLDCASGRGVASATMPAELAAEPVAAPAGNALYASLRGGALVRYSLPGLHEQAHLELGFEASALAVGDGPDAVVLAGGHGADAMSAHDPVNLVEVHRFRISQPFTVAAMRDAPERRRFLVAFADLAEAWEIAYGHDAPPVLQGLVHDYRSNEAVPLPGRFTPRRFELPGPTRALVAGPTSYEVARLDDTGALGIVNLEVRRQIERPVIAPPGEADRIAPWRGDTRRGWLIARRGASHADVLDASDWSVSTSFEAGGEILALAAAGGRVLLAVATRDGVGVSLVDVSRRVAEPLATGIADARLPLRFVQGTGGCVALLDRDLRWLAGFAAPASAVR